MPFTKENHTIYIEGKAYLLPCFWKGRLSSFRRTKASGHAGNGGDTPAALRQAVPIRPSAGQFCRISVVSCPVSSAACRTGCPPARSKFPTRKSFCRAHRCTSTRPADNKMKSASSRAQSKEPADCSVITNCRPLFLQLNRAPPVFGQVEILQPDRPAAHFEAL